MLREFENLLSDKLAISADKDTLKDQVADFEPLYQEIMGKEHEIVMLISRGRDVIAKVTIFKWDMNIYKEFIYKCM